MLKFRKLRELPRRAAEIDPVILAASQRQSKVAIVVWRVQEAFEKKGVKVPEELVAERIRDLVRRGRLVAFGNTYNWRYSEVKAITRTGT